MAQITSEQITAFFAGKDPMERVITLECGYDDEYVSVVYKTPEGNKRIRREEFKPFVWVQGAAIGKMCGGRTGELKRLMGSYGIGAKSLRTKVHPDDKPIERIENGYTLMFYAKARMPYQKFLNFFKKTGVPVYGKKDKDGNFEKSERYILSVSPIEQHMMRTGKRLFKGYDNYDDLKRLVFDLETQGLNARVHRIEQIGIRTNKGYKNVIPVSSFEEELPAIRQFLKIIREEKPDVVIGHNSENFDWGFIETRCEMHGTTLQEVSGEFFPNPIYKRKNETVLKLGGEVEYYRPTVIWGHNVVDSLHAVRRAQAIDSNMESASLKYVTRYLDLKKPNRVYVPGNQISTIWNVTDPLYAFNDEDGDWYRTSEEKPLRDNYEAVSGQYVVKRYLLDDLWETDKIEVKLNEANFLVAKMLPTTFQRACTMGTAGIWKLIMLAWCCENDLAVPAFSKRRRFTGGLSRLLKTGYVDRIVKLDYNSLYPSIILTWHIVTSLDIMGVMPAMLEYVLTGREKYKGLKKKAGKTAKQLRALLETLVNKEDIRKMELEVQKWSSEEIGNDKKQLPLKTLGNSYFGSFGAPNLFPYGDSMAAEKTTCIGRMCLRLMISHFTSIGYEPIVGDSFTGDTPLFVRREVDGRYSINIMPIAKLFDDKSSKKDLLGREYDNSDKPYEVLCGSGWEKPSYLYRHKTDKDIVRVERGDMKVDVTEDHSLFNGAGEKIKPGEVKDDTELKYYDGDDIFRDFNFMEDRRCLLFYRKYGIINSYLLNSSIEIKREFLERTKSFSARNKTEQAKYYFIRNCVSWAEKKTD